MKNRKKNVLRNRKNILLKRHKEVKTYFISYVLCRNMSAYDHNFLQLSRNDSLSHISDSLPHPSSLYKCWIFPGFVAKSLKPCEQQWFGGRAVFSLKNRFSILSQQFCPRKWLIDIFWKNFLKLLNGIEMHVDALNALNSINSKF